MTLDDALVGRLDRAAREHGVTRSALLESMAERDLRRRAEGRQREVRTALAALKSLAERHGTGDDEVATDVRRMRDDRSDALGRG